MAMMAAQGLLPSLNIPAFDDNMEISSDVGHDADVDVELMDSDSQHDEEIDYMYEDDPDHNQAVDSQHLVNDDLMHEDAEGLIDGDDMRDDEGVPDFEEDSTQFRKSLDMELPQISEETLYDATQEEQHDPEEEVLIEDNHEEEVLIEDNQEEEVLIDYDDEEEVQLQNRDLELETGEEPLIDWNDNAVNEYIRPEIHGESSLIAENDLGAAVNQNADTNDQQVVESTTQDAPNANEAETATERPDSVHVEDLLDTQHAHSQIPKLSEQNVGGETSIPVIQHQGADPTTDVIGETSGEVPVMSPTLLHPVDLIYNEAHLPLFPLSEDSGGSNSAPLLDDSSVAHGTLTEFFSACRQALGQEVTSENELELYVENLDLSISEDSIHCMTTSLAQIIEVYVALMHNDGIERPEPMTLFLTIKIRFTTQLMTLFQASSEHKGLSQLEIPEITFEAEEYDEYCQAGEGLSLEERVDADGIHEEQDKEQMKSEDALAKNQLLPTAEEAFLDNKAARTHKSHLEISSQSANNAQVVDGTLDASHTDTEKLVHEIGNTESVQQSRSEDYTGATERGQSNTQTRQEDSPGRDALLLGAAEDVTAESTGSSTVQEEGPAITQHLDPHNSEALPLVHEENNKTSSSEVLREDLPANASFNDHTEEVIEETGYQDNEWDNTEYDGGILEHEWNEDETQDTVDDEGYEQTEQIDVNEQVEAQLPSDENHETISNSSPTHRGVFKVPSESQADDDEIDYDDDDAIDYDDDDNTTIGVEVDHDASKYSQHPSSDSPLGKRNREDEDGTEAKRLKAD